MFSKFSFAPLLGLLLLAVVLANQAISQTPTPSPKPEKKMEMEMPMATPTPSPSPDPKKQSSEDDPHSHHMMDMDKPKVSPTPEARRTTVVLPEPEADFHNPMEHSMNNSLVLIELLEYDVATRGKNSLNWDMIGWYGGDYNRFWFRSEGEISQSAGSSGRVEVQGLYGRMIAPYYDFQVGVRHDQKWKGAERHSRFHAVVGLTGLVPYEYEVEPLLFVSDKGDVSFRFTGVKDILLTQKSVFEARFETNLAVQKVENFGVGTGLNDMKFGFRVRREITREFAPYVGFTYKRLFGGTADFARLEGEKADRFSLVAGVRIWF